MMTAPSIEPLVVGMYERGLSLPPERRVIDIGGSHQMGSFWLPWKFCINRMMFADPDSDMPAERQLELRQGMEEAVASLVGEVARDKQINHLTSAKRGAFLAYAAASRLGMSVFNLLALDTMPGERVLVINDETNWGMLYEVRSLRSRNIIVNDGVSFLDMELNPGFFVKNNLETRGVVTARNVVNILGANGLIPSDLHGYIQDLRIGPRLRRQPQGYEWSEFRRQPAA